MIDHEPYDGPERRVHPKTLEQLEQDIIQMFRDHEDREREMIAVLRREFLSGFPNGDLQGHCAYHGAKIKAAQAEEEFWKTARSEALKHGIAGSFAVLKWVAILAALGVAYQLGVGPAVAKVFGVAP